MSLRKKYKLKKGVLIIFLSLLFSEVFSQSIDYGLAVTGNSSSYGVKRSAAQRKNFNYPLNYGASAGISLRYSPSKQQISRKFPFEPTFQSEAKPVSYTHLRAHETGSYLVCRILL